MLIVIPGALPDLSVAGELARHLPQRAPVLHAWLQAGRAESESFDVRAQGCTPFEAWQLGQAGFAPGPDQALGAGLGPLRAPEARPGEPVWLAELVHLALGTDQATLMPPDQLDLRADEDAALYALAAPLFGEQGFGVERLAPGRWRVRLPDGLAPRSASPAAVAGQRLDAWWQHDAATRPWRRLLNEIQMAWHEQPVNEARAARGVAPINGLWLYGGALPWTLTPGEPAQVLSELERSHREGDWGRWLEALARLDAEHLAPLADARHAPRQPLTLLLLGADRRARLTLKPRSGLAKWLPAPKHKWNAWWSHPV